MNEIWLWVPSRWQPVKKLSIKFRRFPAAFRPRFRRGQPSQTFGQQGSRNQSSTGVLSVEVSSYVLPDLCHLIAIWGRALRHDNDGDALHPDFTSRLVCLLVASL